MYYRITSLQFGLIFIDRADNLQFTVTSATCITDRRKKAKTCITTSLDNSLIELYFIDDAGNLQRAMSDSSITAFCFPVLGVFLQSQIWFPSCKDGQGPD